MEALLSTLLGKLVALGGGYILAAIMMLMFFRERKESRDLSATLVGMATAQTAACVKTAEVLMRVEETLKELERRL